MHRRRALTTALAAPLAALTLVGTGQIAWGAVTLGDLFDADLRYSATARALDGQRIAVTGFMAPPLKPDARFFILTKQPMRACPFCQDGSTWPDNVLMVLTKRPVDPMPHDQQITAHGVLELGPKLHETAGIFSRMRMVDARYG